MVGFFYVSQRTFWMQRGSHRIKVIVITSGQTISEQAQCRVAIRGTATWRADWFFEGLMVPLGANELVCSPGPAKHMGRGRWGFACCSHGGVAVVGLQGHLVN